jgi:hypothetical protein
VGFFFLKLCILWYVMKSLIKVSFLSFRHYTLFFTYTGLFCLFCFFVVLWYCGLNPGACRVPLLIPYWSPFVCILSLRRGLPNLAQAVLYLKIFLSSWSYTLSHPAPYAVLNELTNSWDSHYYFHLIDVTTGTEVTNKWSSHITSKC